MKKIINIFLWLSIIFHGVMSFGILFFLWGPLYLAIVKMEEIDLAIWSSGAFIGSFIGFIISIMIYQYIRDRRLIILQKNLFFTILLGVDFYFNISFLYNILWLHFILIGGSVILLVIHPMIVKKYY